MSVADAPSAAGEPTWLSPMAPDPIPAWSSSTRPGLNDNIRGICRRFAEHGYAALGVDPFGGRNRVVCVAKETRPAGRSPGGMGMARATKRGGVIGP